jgi:hypothetical protein
MIKVNVLFVSVLMFVAVSCIAQTTFKVGMYQDGEYELIEKRDGSGVDGLTLTELLLRSTENERAIRAANILRTSIDLRNAGHNILANGMQRFLGIYMMFISMNGEDHLPILNTSILEERNAIEMLP